MQGAYTSGAHGNTHLTPNIVFALLVSGSQHLVNLADNQQRIKPTQIIFSSEQFIIIYNQALRSRTNMRDGLFTDTVDCPANVFVRMHAQGNPSDLSIEGLYNLFHRQRPKFFSQRLGFFNASQNGMTAS